MHGNNIRTFNESYTCTLGFTTWVKNLLVGQSWTNISAMGTIRRCCQVFFFKLSYYYYSAHLDLQFPYFKLIFWKKNILKFLSMPPLTMALIAATTTTASAVATVAATAAEVWRRRGGVCRDGCVVVARKSQKPYGDFTQQRDAMFLTLSWNTDGHPRQNHGSTMAEFFLFKTTPVVACDYHTGG